MKSKAKFVIGDIQGCYKEFKNLLKKRLEKLFKRKIKV